MEMNALISVLNALRHQWFGRFGRAAVQSVAGVVLNALRHQWFGRVSCPVTVGRPKISAQRLAASVVWQVRPLKLLLCKHYQKVLQGKPSFKG